MLLKRNKQTRSLICSKNCEKFMAITFRCRADVKYFMQTQLLRFYEDTAKVSSLPWFKITTKSTHFLPAKKEAQRQCPEVFLGKGVLLICSKLTRECPCLNVSSINLQRNFIEIILCHGRSPVNLLHIFRAPTRKNTSGWLLLKTPILWIELQTNKIQKVSKPYI